MIIKNKVRMEHNKNVYIFYVYFLYNKIIKFIQKKVIYIYHTKIIFNY